METYIEAFTDKNNENCKAFSVVPEECKQNDCVLGIDEAGRGPVLGPLVYGCCYVSKRKSEEFSRLGCADSKSLSDIEREKLFEIICNNCNYVGWRLDIICPTIICQSMYRRSKCSLNEISHDSAIGLIKDALTSGVKVTEVYVDTVGPPEKYQKKLSELFPDIEIIVSKKADSIYPVVSGASICAKVARDLALKNWKVSETIDIDSSTWGSGYPNDPLTKKFLNDNVDLVFGFPQLVRFSWSTSERILEKHAVQVTWDEADESEVHPSNKPNILNFFSKAKANKKDHTTHAFFKSRYLSNVTDF